MDSVNYDENVPLRLADKQLGNGNEINNEVLTATKKRMNHMLFIGFTQAYLYASVLNIWILYAREFYGNTHQLSVILYTGWVTFALLSLIISPISDHIGHDKMITILYTIMPIGLFLEACAQDIEMLSIGYIISRLPAYLINFSYVAWILPLHYSKQYTGTLYQCTAVAFSVSPIVSGVISYFTSYRISFLVTSVVSLILAVYTWFFVYNSQNNLELQQMQMKSYYKKFDIDDDTGNASDVTGSSTTNDDNDNPEKEKQLWQTSIDYRYPSVLQRMEIENQLRLQNMESMSITGHRSGSTTLSADAGAGAAGSGTIATSAHSNSSANTIGSDDIMDHIEREQQSGYITRIRKSFASMSMYEWYLLLNIIWQNALVGSVETVVITWYCVYMEDTFNTSILVSTIQLGEICLGLVTGSQAVKLFAKNIRKWTNGRISSSHDSFIHTRKQYTLTNVFVIISIIVYGINIFISVCFYPYQVRYEWVDLWYVFAIIYGFFLGVGIMCTEMILLELQNKEIVGLITGIKGFVRTMAQGMGILLVGTFWEYNTYHVSLWYIQGIFFIIGTVLMFAMIVPEYLNVFGQKPKN